jgi:hypothetical protein
LRNTIRAAVGCDGEVSDLFAEPGGDALSAGVELTLSQRAASSTSDRAEFLERALNTPERHATSRADQPKRAINIGPGDSLLLASIGQESLHRRNVGVVVLRFRSRTDFLNRAHSKCDPSVMDVNR